MELVFAILSLGFMVMMGVILLTPYNNWQDQKMAEKERKEISVIPDLKLGDSPEIQQALEDFKSVSRELKAKISIKKKLEDI